MPPWPGEARIYPSVGWSGRHLYVVSGARLLLAADGSVSRRFLRDGLAYDPATRNCVYMHASIHDTHHSLHFHTSRPLSARHTVA